MRSAQSQIKNWSDKYKAQRKQQQQQKTNKIKKRRKTTITSNKQIRYRMANHIINTQFIWECCTKWWLIVRKVKLLI